MQTAQNPRAWLAPHTQKRILNALSDALAPDINGSNDDFIRRLRAELPNHYQLLAVDMDYLNPEKKTSIYQFIHGRNKNIEKMYMNTHNGLNIEGALKGHEVVVGQKRSDAYAEHNTKWEALNDEMFDFVRNMTICLLTKQLLEKPELKPKRESLLRFQAEMEELAKDSKRHLTAELHEALDTADSSPAAKIQNVHIARQFADNIEREFRQRFPGVQKNIALS